jgi:hypothetical protein
MELVKASWSPMGGREVKKQKEVKAMKEPTKQAETQTNQTKAEAIAKNIAEKLLSGRELTLEEALELTKREVVGEVYFYLWHLTFWGW